MRRWNSNTERSRNFRGWKTLMITVFPSASVGATVFSASLWKPNPHHSVPMWFSCLWTTLEQIRKPCLRASGRKRPEQGQRKKCLSTMRLLLITQYRCSVAVVSKKSKKPNTWCAWASTSHPPHHLLSPTAVPKLATVFSVISVLFVHCLSLPEGFPHLPDANCSN